MAISAVQLLKSFMHVGEVTDRVLAWQTAILVVFVLSALLLAVSEWIASKGH